ncbi:ImmA/IrrE family metallo-endopeptidase [Corynebacterium yudongzhengii]|uniref:ImmA/IrrE family metallo-endopeptidase n=1 Tax=Corynebacterium yudongzhengii TaxID=2080740 RepID=A0A2U1T6T1_9CORY|nr:ImmA/IrrE family metallo-endopeptidase [Corynebacterium yudongzhengii]AWB82250.1 ImmA/IrrE family metallo-endopeptidase [Corynebacterium yudongzhengii]PWC01699.1 ImmA/IrrE family metallo-endopeptidase [Corynebacterium yudongzhengii]
MKVSTTDPEKLAHELGVTIFEHDTGEKGRYYGYGIISLRRGLGYRARRCTLAHELAHYILDHNPRATGWWKERQENAADQWAADLLITPERYRDAENTHGPHSGAIALELGVTTHVINTWRNHYQRKTA